MLYNILHGNAPNYLLQPITDASVSHSYTTRFCDLVPVPRFRTNLKQNSFYVKVSQDYNLLPEYIRNSRSLVTFKYKVKVFLLNAQGTQ